MWVWGGWVAAATVVVATVAVAVARSPELVVAMLRLFATAPWSVRWGLMQQQGRELALLGKFLNP